MKNQNIVAKYALYFFYVFIVIVIIASGMVSLKLSKKNNILTREILEITRENLDIIRGRICELFSEGVGICNKECTLTSCSYIAREDFLKPVTSDIKILEIGPYIAPFFTGENVKYFDIMDTDGIKNQILFEKNEAIKNYVDSNADLSKVPHIDYVHKNGDMSSIKEKFDMVFSSHNIEHQIDLIDHLNQVANLLNSGGKFYLIIPDKRYCFDHFIPESSLSDIIDNHYNYSKSHSLKTILAMSCETTHNDVRLHWQGEHGQVKGRNFECYNEAVGVFKETKGEYLNAHRWRFTPQQFEFVIDSLYNMNIISLKVEKVYRTQYNTTEFMAVLKKAN